MARRGFFAEISHQVRQAEKARARAEREEERARKAAIRDLERARKKSERLRQQAVRAHAAEKKRLEKEARAAHFAARQAEVDKQNSELEQQFQEIESLLAATLDVDDYVDLDSLRKKAEHPAFGHPDLEVPIQPPEPPSESPEPVFIEPRAPKGLAALFGRKKAARAVAAANEAHVEAVTAWRSKVEELKALHKAELRGAAEREEKRLERLKAERGKYEKECAEREKAVAEHNSRLDTFITNLGYGTAEAIQEYVSIVLANSVYPPVFPVDHDFDFDPNSAELRLRVVVPPPEAMPTVKAYRYVKSKDEIMATSLSQKASKERYESAIHQVALRSVHEVFEADRRGLIRTISMELGTETVRPATGRMDYFPFVALATDRDQFLELNLSAVVPTASLEHLGAVISKNPFGLVTVDASGVRQA
ncbi:MAG: hypothetical protein AAF604_03225 [Acidobacteriota bacterium]